MMFFMILYKCLKGQQQLNNERKYIYEKDYLARTHKGNVGL